MITCKEDLINTYIENDHGELRDLYLAEGGRFGLYSEILKGAYTDEYVAIMPHCAAAQSCSKIPEPCLGGQITLSDLKPVKQYAVLHKGGGYLFQSDKPIGDDVVACFDLVYSEKPLSEGFFDENRQDDKQMKTYNTYQEAKIANPECEIAKLVNDNGVRCAIENDTYIGCFTPVVKDSSKRCGYAYFDEEMRGSPNITDGCWVICSPYDHCMTVEEFLKAGHRLDVGDLFIDCLGQVVDVKGENVDTVNIPHVYDNKRHILRAAALEEKPRTKVEYVKVDDSIWHLETDFRCGELFAFDGSRDYVQIETEGDFTLSHSFDNLYRRIETEIDERQEFIDAACNEVNATVDSDAAEDFAKLYDSGKFKLVN